MAQNGHVLPPQQNPDVKALLRWAELENEPITLETVAAARLSNSRLESVVGHSELMSFHIWGFLDVDLVKHAWDVFDGLGMENGLKLWRAVKG